MKLQENNNAIAVHGANVHLGNHLPDHARRSIARVAGKYFGRLNAARVHFSRDGIAYRCTVTMQMGGLARKSAEAADKDIYEAFEAALEKITKQLRRAKRELRDDQAIRIDKDVSIHTRFVPAPQGRPMSMTPMHSGGDRW